MTSQNTVLYTPFADGRTVRDIVEHSPALVSEAWCRHLIAHVLQSLEQQYASNAPHRIISPDSVVVLENGDALLLPSPDGLASDEADSAGDIHALALVIHYAVSAEDPPDGPLGPRLYDDYSDQLTHTIDRCLGPNLRLRPKSIPELRALLGLDAVAAAPAAEAMPAPRAASANEALAAEPPAQVAPLNTAGTRIEPGKADEQEPAEPPASPASPAAPAAPAAVVPPPSPEVKPARPIAATPLKPSSHASHASHSAPAAPPPALPVRPRADRQPLAARKKRNAIERWAMVAGAAVVLLAAGSALYAHLNQDNANDLVAVSGPQGGLPQEAAQGLDAGEAVVAPASGGADSLPAEPGTAPADAAAAGAAALPGPANGNGALTSAAPGGGAADAVVNGTTYKLLIKPWGTVYVNGVDRGVSPPVKRLTLGQGEHTIRIVNPNFAEHVMTVNAGSAESATIEHDFTAQAAGGQ